MEPKPTHEILTMGEQFESNARKWPDKLAVKDWQGKKATYKELDERVNKLANGLLDLGLEKGDHVALMLHNRIEFIECLYAFAKAGLISCAINWRYTGKMITHIVNNSDSKAIIVEKEFLDRIKEVKSDFQMVEEDKYIAIDAAPEGYINYEDLIRKSSSKKPDVEVSEKDTWIIVYTSGTTGLPKGCVRSHGSYAHFYLNVAVDNRFTINDYGMIVMPLFHVNSTFYGPIFNYIGASLYVGSDKGFDAREFLKTVEREKITFTSLIPTHYNLILSIPEEERKKYDVSSLKKILCSSAPATPELKKRIMDYFKGVELYEAYGSTEAGIVTILLPEDQIRKAGSIGKETTGTYEIKLLDENKREVPVGEVGELYSRGSMMFDGYYKMPEKTREAFYGEYFSAGDMAKKDEEGYYYLVERKHNMIITGGEHVYPSIVEKTIKKLPEVFDCAVVGLQHWKWGEAVTAFVILKEGKKLTEQQVIDFCKKNLAKFEVPKAVVFIRDEEMPRSPTGKILHVKLREKYKDFYKDLEPK